MVHCNLFSPHQYGFLAGKSCVSQLIDELDDWTKILDNGGNVDIVYTDFMKAFDKVPHQRLLLKVESYGITGDILLWIKDFLANRIQRVCVEGHFSDWSRITSGIPQGSVLGPILFLIFINDLPECISDCSIKIFADDTKLYKEITSLSDCGSLQQDLNCLYNWSELWQLRFHPDKCQVLRLGKYHPEFRYSMLNYQGSRQELDFVSQQRDLGITIDKDLHFKEHISVVVNKANCILGIIRRTFRYLDAGTLLLLYKVMVRPVLEYGLPAWSPIYKREANLIESVQRRATKLIPGMNHLCYSERLLRLNLFTLAHRRLRGDMIYVYNYLHGRMKTSHNLFTLNTASTTRGHCLKLVKPRVNTSIRQSFFTQRSIDSWNILPEYVISAPSIDSFKGRLDIYWKQKSGVYHYNI